VGRGLLIGVYVLCVVVAAFITLLRVAQNGLCDAPCDKAALWPPWVVAAFVALLATGAYLAVEARRRR
jgi:hypothetical protein